MGQIAGKTKALPLEENRVPYDEDSNNGFIFQDKYIPEELILQILCFVDHKTLRNCQLVCKGWNILMQTYVWKKKAEMTICHSLPINKDAPWMLYYYICDKKFHKNLIKNHSGKNGLHSHWTIVDNGGDGWKIENPPVGAPNLPEDPIFDGQMHCFVTSYYRCWKYQIVNLSDSGIAEHLLDILQPPILVSEWYSSRWDCPSVYICKIELLTDKNVVLDSYNFAKILEEEDQNTWFKFEYKFSNYGRGLRKIRFSHGGQDRNFWKGHYGNKMAGACISLGIPQPKVDS